MKKNIKILLIIISCISIKSYSQELIVNGDFETNDFTGWEINNCNLQTDPATGSYNGNIKNGYGFIKQTITVTPNKLYSVSFKYKTFNGSATNSINASIKNSADDSVIASSVNFDLTTLSYISESFSFTPTNGVTSVYFQIFKNNDPGGNNAIKLDDVSIMINTSESSKLIDPATPVNQQPQGNVPGDWEIEFSDEFNGSASSTPNTDRWMVSESTKSRGLNNRDPAISDWWWKKDNVSINGVGQLELEGEKFDHNTMHCGSVETRNLYEPTYGYFEVRIKIAETAKANHTAFWFQGHNQGNVDNSAEDGVEIDVFESAWVSNKVNTVLHYDGYGANHVSYSVPYNAPNLHVGYHTFGLHWTKDFLQTYYDGVPVTSTNSTKVFPIVTNKSAAHFGDKLVPQIPEWLWLSVGASFGDGDFGSQPTGTLSVAKIDWVRAYKSNESLNVEDNFTVKDFILYPNPVKDFVTIETKAEEFKITVFDLNGKILHKSNNSKSTKIDIKTFNNGLYFFKISSKKRTKVYKVIKN
ncbi:T9SS type A sorting domain-containing protein [Polaribacter atrinae]|uniref:T9SS type A sorting domain-containing protein n=1 Tax=Polaribacter atrinae TaxID=1333662 RepID=UPI002492A729|nr:T9SS type A sorting domain-containing protein [Polaribacter atrinae]